MSHIADLAGKDPLSRRYFLEKTAKLTLGVSVGSSIMQGSLVRAATGGGKAKNLIYIFLGGGLSHTDSFDPKAKNKGLTDSISTKSDFQLSEHLPLLAKQSQHLCLINSMSSQNGDHRKGSYLMRTGYNKIGSIVHPTVGPFAQELLGRRNKDLPDSVVIGQGTSNAGYLHPSLSPLPISDPDAGVRNVDIDVSGERFQRRMEIAQKLGQKFTQKYQYSGPKSYVEYYDQANTLLSGDALKAFDISSEKDRERYGMNKAGQGCLLARRLVEHGVRVVEVQMGGWDMHNDIKSGLQNKMPSFDQAVAALIADLAERGLLEDTLVAVGTEFGRTPGINKNSGRDHYPIAFSTMFAGGGIAGGQKYGETDAEGRKVQTEKVRPTDFLATMGHAMGLPLDTVIYSATRRPFSFANAAAANGKGGKPITSIFA